MRSVIQQGKKCPYPACSLKLMLVQNLKMPSSDCFGNIPTFNLNSLKLPSSTMFCAPVL